MRFAFSFNRFLQKSGICLASGLTLLGTSPVLGSYAVKADEIPIVKASTSQKTVLPEILGKTQKTVLPEILGKIQKTAPLEILGKNKYIDATEYEVHPKAAYTAPSKVIVIERRSNCRTVVEQGQLIKGQCAITRDRSKVTEVAAREMSPRSEHSVALRINPQRLTRRLHVPVYVASISPRIAYSQPVSPAVSEVPFNTVPLNQVYPQLGLEAVPLEYSRATGAPSLTPSADGKTSLIFPLSIPAAISSAFGWRIHPITGIAKMHTGTDIAAPLGTPVLAAYPGEVATAGWTQGYGLMISLLHEGKTQESRYAHLSEIYVRPGEWVEQGTIIGKVGSTGFSTGPHLHFEWRHIEANGSIPVDAGAHIQYALDNLLYSLQRAQTPTDKPQG